jgi:hypothetical protein
MSCASGKTVRFDLTLTAFVSELGSPGAFAAQLMCRSFATRNSAYTEPTVTLVRAKHRHKRMIRAQCRDATTCLGRTR